MKNYCIIGDVHGCYETLVALLKKIPEDDHICFVGDLVDRGPRSKEVVQLVMDRGYDCVQGNHDYWMGEYPKDYELWFDARNGGYATVHSYDMVLPQDHVDFIRNLPLFHFYENQLLVTHSSAARVWPIADRSGPTRDVVQWNRNLPPKKIKGIFNVFGHTVQERPQVWEHFACIDTGAAFGKKLTALRWPSMEIMQQENLDVRH